MEDNALMRGPAYGVYPHLNPRRNGLQPRDTSGDLAALAEFGLSVAPGSGEAMSARDAWNASGQASNALLSGRYGDAASGYGNMLAALVGAVPGIGVVARGTQRGAAWMDRNMPGAVNRLLDRMAPKDAANTLNIFAGPTAKTADHAALAKARELKATGASREQIWDETGWDLDKADGVPRFEIDDSGSADISPMGIGLKDFNGKARSTFYHPEYYKAYPEAADMNVRYTTEFSGGQGYGTKGFLVGAKDKEARRSTSLHELQHDAQHREGFPIGENPGRYPDLSKEEALDIYRRAAGEVEARNVQSRMNMSAAERRAKAPWLTQDVPDEQQIARNAPSTLFSGAGPVGKSNPAIASEIEREIRDRLSKDADAYYGVRITENPLEVGQVAPSSKNWYADFISDDHPTFGREAFPDHGTDLPGPSVVGMGSDRDIEKALKAANILPSHYYYPGNHISLIRGDKRIHGEDPGEWIMPGGEVVASWVKE